jgi:exodeoxyribonuclease VII large subunit
MQELSGDTRKIWTVTELNRAARCILEEAFPRVWVEGEISNFKLYHSGHAYFSLKDGDGQISAAMFRFSARDVKFEVRDGLAVVAAGELTLYEKRGQYQLVVESLEPKGKGALQLAFEQLREKLRGEGLFEDERKRPLPLLPRRVGVVTSPKGAAVRDIINVLQRRYSTVGILLNPVRVQGEGAAGEIAGAIREFNARQDVDVLIVGRGGGSMEDLWAFNEEEVARAIAASEIPVVSAVGHESDFTIADFVADLRAPTPSAAAELVVQNKRNLESRVEGLSKGLFTAVSGHLQRARHGVESLAVQRVISDRMRVLRELAQGVDDLDRDLRSGIASVTEERRRTLARLREVLSHLSPRARQALLAGRFVRARERLEAAAVASLRDGRKGVARLAAQLGALSPLAVLARGYSICRLWPSMDVVKDAGAVAPRSELSVRLHRGELHCRVLGSGGPDGEEEVDS